MKNNVTNKLFISAGKPMPNLNQITGSVCPPLPKRSRDHTFRKSVSPDYIFTICDEEGARAILEGERGGWCKKTGYSFILLNGRPINWLDSNGRPCWPKAKISDGICIEGENVYYTGERGDRCELNMSGGTNHGPNKQPRIARLGYLIKK